MTQDAEKASGRAERIGATIARYRSLRVRYLPQQELVGDMDELRHVGLQSPGEPQEVMVVLEATFSGKTTAAQLFRRNVEAQLAEGSTDIPVVIATAPAGCSSRALAAALLRSAGAKFAPGMTEDALWEAWPKVCRRRGIQIAIVDEVQHTHDGKFSRGVTNTLKNQLAVNIPLIVLGTRSADQIFSSHDDFCSRTYDTVSLRPMVWGEPQDEEIWSDFCNDLDAAMNRAGIVGDFADLVGYAEPLCRAALGRIGLLKKIVQTALRLSLRRRDVTILPADLEKAVDVWAIRHRHVTSNPFRASEAGRR